MLLGSAVGPSHARGLQRSGGLSLPRVEKRRAPEVDAGTVLVELADRVDATSVAADHGARKVAAIAGTRFAVLATNGRGRRVLVRELRDDRRVLRVEGNHVRFAFTAPSDAYYAKGRQAYLRSSRFEQAWGVVPSAAGVTVAVLDTGVDVDNPELAGRLVPGRDVVNGDGDASDDNGHGTEVAGVLAAAHDGVGIAGAAPGTTILPVKVLDANGRGTDADIASGIVWAADHGAQVINLSLGAPGDSGVLREAVAYALSKDAVVVASSGNDEGTTPNFPAAIPGAVAVAATDWEGDAAFFTSYGDWVDVAAPGWDLWTTARTDGAGASYTSFTGTSASAPLVAGTAALLRAQHRDWTQQQVVERIVRTALDVGPRGRDPYHGAGLVDAYAAVGGAAQPYTAPPPGDAAEPNAAPDRATSLALNAVVWSTISPQGDNDWFKFTVASTGDYLVTVQPETYRDPRPQELDPVVDLFDAGMRLVMQQDHGGIDAQESLLVSLSAGTYFVRVHNYAPSRSAGAYAIKVEPYSSGTVGRFLRFDTFDVGSFPMSTAVGDVTGDGRGDMLVATTPYGGSPYDASLLVFPQVDDGWLDWPTQVLPIGTTMQDTPALAVGDLDGDGRADAALGTFAGIQLFRQQANGGLAASTTVDLPAVRDLVLADMNGDGRRDIVVQTVEGGISTSENGIYVLTAPSWTRTAVEEGVTHGELEVGDLNSDGRADVAAIAQTRSFASQRVDTYLQGTAANWTAGPTLSSPYFPDGIAVGDVTGDGKADIVTASWESRGIALFAQSAGGFAAPVGFADNGAGAVTIADMNGDGRKDVVSGDFGTLGIHLQRADGTLSPAEETGFGADTVVLPKGIAVGDFTGDGVPDVALAPYSYGWVSVLRQRTASWPLPVWVRNTTPAEGGSAAGSVSIVLGRGVDAATVSASSVTLENASTGAAVPATVAYDTATRKITVQASLTSGAPYVAKIDGVRDALGNTLTGWALRFTAGAAPADTTAPDTVIYDGPPPRIKRDSELRIHHYGTEAGTRFQCSMDSGTWNDCSEHYALAGPYGEGAHTFRVRAVDGAGNVDATPASRSWTVDPNIVTPANDSFSNAQPIAGGSGSGSVNGTNVEAWYDNLATIASNPGGRSVWYRWTAPARVQVTFDTVGSDFDTLLGVYTGTSPFALTSVAEDDDSGGSRASRVSFVAAAGQEYMIAVDGYAYEMNAATGKVVLRWSSTAVADVTAPKVSLTSPADGATVGTSASLGADASDDAAVAKVEFLADASVFATDTTAPYSATWVTTSLAAGVHRLAARATDLSGNVTTSAERTVTVDNAPPETTIASGPSTAAASTSAGFGFAASEAGSSFECSLDAAAFASCTSPRSYSGLAEGQHSFRVRAVDAVGNVDPTPASRSWTVDTTAPETTITSAPADLSPTSSASFAFASNESGARFACSLDAAAPADCNPPVTYSGLGDGTHVFRVQAFDPAGNADATPAARSWTVDTTAPETTIDSAPAGTVASRSASVAFSATETGSRFECSLDTNAFAACTSPAGYSALADGQHVFRVRAIDAAANVDATPATQTWTVDLSSPAPALTPWTAYGLGGGPAAVAAADVTGDGRADALVTTHAFPAAPYAAKLFLLAQQPDGSLGSPVALATDEAGGGSADPLQIATGDLNGDGRADVAVATNQGVDVFYQQAPGVLTTRTLLPTHGGSAIVIEDVDGDGRRDIVVATLDGVVLLRNTGTGFAAQTIDQPSATFALADLNADGRLDVVSGWVWNGGQSGHSYSVAVCLQRADGTFAPRTSYLISTTVDPNQVAAGDVTGDGRTDVVVTASANSPNAKIYVLAGAGNGTLRAPVTYATYDLPNPVHLGDVNGDGRSDVVLLHDGWERVGVLLQQSDGTLAAEQLFSLPYAQYGPDALDVGDVTGDGLLDFLVADENVGLVIRRGSSSTPGPAAGANDAFAAAKVLTTNGGVTTGDLTGATRETGERAPSGQQTVWYRWTAPADGEATFDARDGSTVPWLSVYTGASVGSLALVAEPGTGTLDAIAKVGRARFRVSAGVTYSIQISNAPTAGQFQLGWIFDRWSSSLDTTAPTVRMRAPVETLPYQLVHGSYTFSADAADDRGVAWVDFHFINAPTVRVTAAPWSVTLDTRSFPDGQSWVYAVAADAAGNTQQSTGIDFLVDNTPPDTTIDSGPAGTVASASASFGFGASEPSTFQCRLDGAAFAACASPKAYAGLVDGSHTFEVRAADAAGNADATPAIRTWTVDTSPPETTVDSGPSSPTTSSDATLVFGSPDGGASFRCSLDAAEFAACTSPARYTALAAGSHTFRVEALDEAGNVDPSPATYGWTIQVPVSPLPPDTRITSGPPSTTTATDATFEFVSSAAGSSFTCSLDGATFAACSSPAGYHGLAAGNHTFRVEAIDASGGVDPTPAVYAWTIETPPPPSPPAPPDTTITAGPPSPTTATGAIFSFASSFAGAAFRCSLDGAPYAVCSSPASFTALAPGAHTFRVEAVDGSTVDPTPASYDWRIETPVLPPPVLPPPETTITSGPLSTTTASEATFEFVSSAPNSSFRCSLDGAAFAPCSSPASYGGLQAGSHRFQVAATDATGSVDATAAIYAWTIEVAAQPPDTTTPSSAVHGARAVIRIVIRGRPVVGHRLSTTVRPPGEPLRYRWLACGRARCSSIRGATRLSLVVRRAWLGKRLRVTVTALASGAKASATTQPVRGNR
ncbi:MAG: FG-GAP-like repeat-containing protein [Gaiellaceae bacterium]